MIDPITVDEEIVKQMDTSPLRRTLPIYPTQYLGEVPYMRPTKPSYDYTESFYGTTETTTCRLNRFRAWGDVPEVGARSYREQVERAVVESIDNVVRESAEKMYKDLENQTPVVKTDVKSLEQELFNNILYAHTEGWSDIEWMLVVHPTTYFKVIDAWHGNLREIAEKVRRDWLCTYCGTIQHQSLFSCWDGVTGCGAPRPEINADYLCLYCGRTYGEETIICWDGVDGCGTIEGVIKVNTVPGLQSVMRGEQDMQTWAIENNLLFIRGYAMEVIVDKYVPQDRIFMLPKRVMGMDGVGLFRAPTLAKENRGIPSYIYKFDVQLCEGMFNKFPQISRRFDL